MKMLKKPENPARQAVNQKIKWLLAYLLILATGVIFAFLVYQKASNDYDIALEHYRHVSHNDAKEVAENIANVSNQIYQNIRTISFLPSVRKIDRRASNLDEDAHKTIQEIYNNLASSVSVSEVYIVPVDLNPDKIDLATGKPEEPILMFDQLIAHRLCGLP